MAIRSGFSAEIALIGTGLAPLVCARRLMEQGRQVIVLNPELDFFLEDSELPLNPDWRAGFDQALATLRPEFPGPLGTDPAEVSGARLDPKGRIWLSTPQTERHVRWDQWESFYLETSSAGHKSQILDGVGIGTRFPGAPRTTEFLRGIQVPKLWSLSVDRYRFGILEFVRERAGEDRFLVQASGIEPMPGGLRFYHRGESATVRVSGTTVVFWTPRLASLLQSWIRRLGVSSLPHEPLGRSRWNEWSLMSREPINPENVGVLQDAWIWSDPSSALELRVLEKTPLTDEFSLERLDQICMDLLGWEKFSIRSHRRRVLYDWSDAALKEDAPQPLAPHLWVATAVDGPVDRVVGRARKVADLLETRS